MDNDLLGIIEQIGRQRELGRDVLIEAIEKALLQAAKKRYGPHKQISVSIDRNTGEIKVFAPKRVVEIMTDFSSQIPIEEALEIDPSAELGKIIEVEEVPKDFGRIAAQTAKQIVVQRLREAERENIYDEYKDREGQIVSGIVQRYEQHDIIVELDKAEALLPQREQIRHEEYRRGDRIRSIIIEVRLDLKNPQIILSRTHPDLVIRLFELEVPEISDGLVEIKSISREPGDRSKIAVASNTDNLDPVRTCVGMRGSRVQMVVNELDGERIDILEWSLSPEKYISGALSPSKILSVSVNENEKSARVVVPNDQLSLAIGKRGQNVRLAAKLTGWNIDIKSQSEAETETKEKIARTIFKSPSVAELEGVGSRTAEKLQEAGFESIQDIVESNIKNLADVPGIGIRTAEKLYSAAQEKLKGIRAGRSKS